MLLFQGDIGPMQRIAPRRVTGMLCGKTLANRVPFRPRTAADRAKTLIGRDVLVN
jgi:hypothetical protein